MDTHDPARRRYEWQQCKETRELNRGEESNCTVIFLKEIAEKCGK